MNNLTNRGSANVLFVIAAAMVAFTMLILVAVHVRAARSDARALNQECSEEASAFRSAADNLASGSKIVEYASHYNRQRHRCLVDITGTRQEDRGLSSEEQIFDPSDGSFIASCDTLLAGRTTTTIVLGAPVPIRNDSAAQAWFNDLMKK